MAAGVRLNSRRLHDPEGNRQMLPATHVMRADVQRVEQYRKMVLRAGEDMEIIEPTAQSTANAKRFCEPCPNSIKKNNMLRCNFHGCRCRIASPFIKECPKGDF